MELLAGPEAHGLDRLAVGNDTGEADEVAREVHDADRLAHVQDEEVTVAAQRGRVEDRQVASGMVMKKRVMSGWVIVSGSPFSSCCWKIGTTLPVEPSTFPKRTDT